MSDAGMTWTAERLNLLKKLWGEGLSAGQIAAELGGDVTRNAVLGKAHRLGLVHWAAKVPGTPRPRKPTRRPDLSTTAELPVKQDPTPAPVAVDPQPVEQRAQLPLHHEVIVPRSEAVTIMELGEAMCRWPLGDPTTPEFRFCGAQAITGLPYCPHHAQIAYQPVAARKRLRA